MNLSNLSTTTFTWQEDFLKSLNAININYEIKAHNQFCLIVFDGIVINAINIVNPHTPQDLVDLQNLYHAKNVKLIQLWEDVWLSRPKQVLARIQSLLVKNIRIHGRKTIVNKIAKPIADNFLSQNHLQGTVNSRYKLGLFLQEELIGVATFSALRKMKHTDNYTSAELIRFAIKAGYSVTGGLSKLIIYIQRELNPSDIMTYADRDWSRGEAYLKLGFTHTSNLEPQKFSLDQDLNRSLIKYTIDPKTATVFNTGSLKYILEF